MTESAQGEVKSSVRTLQILKLLSSHQAGLTFTEIQKYLEIPKSSLFVLLSTIQQEKWIEFNPKANKFTLGIQAWESTQQYLNSSQLISIAESHITEMMNDLHSSVHLAVLSGADALYLAQIKSDRSYDLPSRVGVRLPAQATALGKSLLTGYNDEEIKIIFKNSVFKKFNSSTIGNLDELLKEVHKVKIQGFSESNGELVERFYCVAAPITDRVGKVVAAISSTVPKRYLEQKVVTKDRMQECVQDEARQVSEELWAYS
jgi:IclR family transcriptional regulator, KDG regulon repressor